MEELVNYGPTICGRARASVIQGHVAKFGVPGDMGQKTTARPRGARGSQVARPAWLDKERRKIVDWENAEKYLATCEKAYTEIGSAGYFALNVVIRPLRDRFNKGERTQELHDEIMDVSL